MAAITSRPDRSADSSGPIAGKRIPKLVRTARSMSAADATPASSSAIASRTTACCMRVPRKPSTSWCSTTGTLPIARTRSVASATRSAAACSPPATSTIGIRCAGFQKCSATTRSRCRSGAAMSVTRRPDVFVASSACRRDDVLDGREHLVLRRAGSPRRPRHDDGGIGDRGEPARCRRRPRDGAGEPRVARGTAPSRRPAPAPRRRGPGERPTARDRMAARRRTRPRCPAPSCRFRARRRRRARSRGAHPLDDVLPVQVVQAAPPPPTSRARHASQIARCSAFIGAYADSSVKR